MGSASMIELTNQLEQVVKKNNAILKLPILLPYNIGSYSLIRADADPPRPLDKELAIRNPAEPVRNCSRNLPEMVPLLEHTREGQSETSHSCQCPPA